MKRKGSVKQNPKNNAGPLDLIWPVTTSSPNSGCAKSSWESGQLITSVIVFLCPSFVFSTLFWDLRKIDVLINDFDANELRELIDFVFACYLPRTRLNKSPRTFPRKWYWRVIGVFIHFIVLKFHSCSLLRPLINVTSFKSKIYSHKFICKC